MVLGRLIRILEAERYSPISPKWSTKVFVLGDVLSFITQGAGGAILARARSMSDLRLGENIIIAGLALQIAFFGVFIVVICVFHYRINANPTNRCHSTIVPWRRFIWILYGASILIMVRSVFRVAEYVMGSDGPLLATEAYLYVFDAALMFVVVGLFNVFHPGRIIQMEHKSEMIPDGGTPVDLHSLTPRQLLSQA
ncbi:hypothetical protein ACHAQA_004351 [Verticillium albo-atrum]